VILVEGAMAAALVRDDPAMAGAAKAAARVLLTAAGVPGASEAEVVSRASSRRRAPKSR
jgi:hypothetical protein